MNMRHIKYFVLLAVCCLSASCVQDRLTPPEEAEVRSSAAKGDLRLVLGDNPATKTEVDGITGAVSWNDGDREALYVDGDGYRTLEVGIDEQGTALVETSLTGGQERANFAIFPAASAVSGHVTESDLWVNYPTGYDLSGMTAAQRDAYAPLPMVAVNDPSEGTLTFYNVGCVLRVTLRGVPATTRSIRLTFGGVNVTGNYLVSDPGTVTPAASTAKGSNGNAVTFTLAAAGETIGTEQDVTLNVPLPPGDYSAFTQITVATLGSSGSAAVPPFFYRPGVAWGTLPRTRGRKISSGYETRITLADGGEKYRFRGLHMAPGVLKYDANTDEGSHGYTITDGTDPLELLPNRTYAHSYGEIYQRWSGRSEDTGDLSRYNSFLNNGITWRIPTTSDWAQIINGSPATANINTISRNYIYVNVDLTDATPENPEYPAAADYSDKGQSGANRQRGILLIPDNALVYCQRVINAGATGGGNLINWSDLKILTDGGCAYLPCLGSSGRGSSGGVLGYYLSANGVPPNQYAGANYYIYMLFIDSNNNIKTSYSNLSSEGTYWVTMPARVIHD
jgi:hypothetical protein